MIVGTAGHIDHGKTALVHALTGVDTDRLPEEKRRGITIELGFAPLILPGLPTVGVIDVPGHEAFIRTMLAGATGIDIGLLVVAADEGVMPQTREHLAILTLLHVRGGVVALTKCDLVDAEWLALVEEEVTALVAGTPLAGCPVIPTSATTGDGIPALREALRATLMGLPLRDANDLVRLPVDRAFTVRGTGTVVTGTTWSGTLTSSTPLRLFPLDRPVRVRALQSHGTAVAQVPPGERAAVALSGVEVSEVGRGAVLVQEGAWARTRLLRGDVALLDGVDRPLRPREWVRLHLGTAEVAARVVASGGALGPGEGRGARLVLDEAIVARAGDRFVIRRASPLETIGGGIVVDPAPARRRSRPWPLHLTREERLRRLVAESGADGLSRASLPVRVGVSPPAVGALIDEVGGVVDLGGWIFAEAMVRETADALVTLVRRYHLAHPLEEAAPVALLRGSVQAGATLFAAALEGAARGGGLEMVAGGVRLRGWAPHISPQAADYLDWLRRRLEEAGGEPPSLGELRQERGDNDPVPYVRILEREGFVVMVEPDRFYAASAVRGLVGRLRSAMDAGRVYSPSELREIVGATRKFLIPFLEYCDRERITERRLEGRVLV